MVLRLRHRSLLALLLLSAIVLVSKADDEDEYTDTDMAGSEDEYSQPGLATDGCICVPFYQCEGGEIVTDGRNVIDPRKKKPVAEELDVDEKYIPPACGPFHVCCREPETSTVQPYVHRCGTRNHNGINSRILSSNGNNEAEFGEWPWQGAILIKEGEAFVFKCGATLIDERHVLTVAHCIDQYIDQKSDLVVRLGEWDTQVKTEFLPHEDFEVEGIVLHSEYNKKNLFNDIAVINLKRDVTFKPHIDTACLPHDDDDFTGHDCVVTGWGTDAYDTDAYSLVMKEMALPVISNVECQRLLRKTRLGRYFKLFGNFMCAGGEKDKDSCKGDGGGPLSCFRSDNSYAIAGLVSWGIECGKEGVPGVYVKVQKYVDWISSVTGKPVSYYWSADD